MFFTVYAFRAIKQFHAKVKSMKNNTTNKIFKA